VRELELFGMLEAPTGGSGKKRRRARPRSRAPAGSPGRSPPLGRGRRSPGRHTDCPRLVRRHRPASEPARHRGASHIGGLNVRGPQLRRRVAQHRRRQAVNTGEASGALGTANHRAPPRRGHQKPRGAPHDGPNCPRPVADPPVCSPRGERASPGQSPGSQERQAASDVTLAPRAQRQAVAGTERPHVHPSGSRSESPRPMSTSLVTSAAASSPAGRPLCREPGSRAQSSHGGAMYVNDDFP
jgi:hypothetical protein